MGERGLGEGSWAGGLRVRGEGVFRGWGTKGVRKALGAGGLRG